MEAQVMLLRESTPAAELAARAISSVVNGEVEWGFRLASPPL